MSTLQAPSTAWQEVVERDEAQRFAGYTQVFAEIQARKSQQHGAGRALHRKQLLAAKGTLEVLSNLPEFARQGLFAAPGRFDAWLRLSNGSFDHASDQRPDIRGLALRVLGVHGDSALGTGPAKSQDFLLINQEAFAFPKSDEFVPFVQAAARSPVALIGYLIKRYGFIQALARLARTAKTMGRPFSGFATEPLHSAVPIACGAYAVRVRLLPAAGNGVASAAAKADWGAEFAARLTAGSLSWELQLQPFVNETLTPIEDASVNWPTPYTTVARLSLPQQDTASPAGLAFAQQAEAGVFDVWQALAAHRPLGDVQRARKAVYYASQQGRGAA